MAAALGLGIYGLTVGFLLLAAGSVIGSLPFIVTALIHMMVGAVLLAGRRGLGRRQRWAATVLMLISVVVLMTYASLVLRALWASGEIPSGFLMMMVINVLFMGLIGSLLRNSARGWTRAVDQAKNDQVELSPGS
jgi:hypothetical protein